MGRISGILPIAVALLLTACATVPTGPSVMVLPGNGKNFEQFQADDAVCRQWAAQQTGTTTQRASYDMSYMQCMYAKGNQIPLARGPSPSASVPPPPTTAALLPARPGPDFRGTWTGTWGDTPLTLFVLTQEEMSTSDVYVSLRPLFGQRSPGLSGILTFTVRGEAISVNVRGRFGDSNGKLTLVLEPVTANGEQISLTREDEDHLTWVGTSRVSWEPQGPVALTRRRGP